MPETRCLKSPGFRGSEALPDEVQCQLDLSRGGGRSLQQARGGNRREGLGEDLGRSPVRYRKVGVVQRIKQLHAELDVEFLIVNVVVLEPGQIEIVQARPDGDVAATIPQSRGGLRRRETCRLDVLICAAGVD